MNDSPKKIIKVCEGNACCMNFSDDIFKEAEKKCENKNGVEVERMGCQARCTQGPIVAVEEAGKREIKTEVSKRDLEEYI